MVSRFFAESITVAEQQELAEWIQSAKKDTTLRKILEEAWRQYEPPDSIVSVAGPSLDRIQTNLLSFLSDHSSNPDQKPAGRVHYLSTYWLRYAAAVIVMIGIGGYIWKQYLPNGTDKKIIPKADVAFEYDIPPGFNKATLTLSTGQKIELKDSVEVIDDAGVRIRKADGELVYGRTDIMAFNTMATPRGGQYKLILPDGSRVWLNAASSITFPTAFPGNERNVKITGEVYFEVVKNTNKPFKVTVNDGDIIEVLGTSFNINAYEDESSVVTTLLEGSVKIKNNILRPGEAYQNGKINKVDVIQAVAWKNGRFSFQDADVYAVMRQLSRWYDVDLEFRRKPDVRFFAIVKRSLNLSDLLKALEVSGGVKFTIEPKKIIVY